MKNIKGQGNKKALMYIGGALLILLILSNSSLFQQQTIVQSSAKQGQTIQYSFSVKCGGPVLLASDFYLGQKGCKDVTVGYYLEGRTRFRSYKVKEMVVPFKSAGSFIDSGVLSYNLPADIIPDTYNEIIKISRGGKVQTIGADSIVVSYKSPSKKLCYSYNQKCDSVEIANDLSCSANLLGGDLFGDEYTCKLALSQRTTGVTKCYAYAIPLESKSCVQVDIVSSSISGICGSGTKYGLRGTDTRVGPLFQSYESCVSAAAGATQCYSNRDGCQTSKVYTGCQSILGCPSSKTNCQESVGSYAFNTKEACLNSLTPPQPPQPPQPSCEVGEVTNIVCAGNVLSEEICLEDNIVTEKNTVCTGNTKCSVEQASCVLSGGDGNETIIIEKRYDIVDNKCISKGEVGEFGTLEDCETALKRLPSAWFVIGENKCELNIVRPGGSGGYATEAECLLHAKVIVEPSWSIKDGKCVAVFEGPIEYTTKEKCELALKRLPVDTTTLALGGGIVVLLIAVAFFAGRRR